LGDETTEDEGPNMQQIPRNEQASFLKLYSQMGQPIACTRLWRCLPAIAARAQHRRSSTPWRTILLLMPMNVQSLSLNSFNLDELPVGTPPRLGPAADHGAYDQAADAIQRRQRVVVRLGGGARLLVQRLSIS